MSISSNTSPSKIEYAALICSPYNAVHINAFKRNQRRFLKHLAFKVDGIYPPIGVPEQGLSNRFDILN